jgi:hypothetical protein
MIVAPKSASKTVAMRVSALAGRASREVTPIDGGAGSARRA